MRLIIRARRLFSSRKRAKLNEKISDELDGLDFTIFSNNCIGGVFYHDAGKKFLSPTINIAFDGEDFIRFLANPKLYFTDDFIFYKWPKHNYPIALNNGVEFRFVHYDNNKECVDKWLDRSKRIVWDNIYIIATDVDGLSKKELLEAFDKLPYRNKIMFTAKKYPQYDWAIFVKQFRKKRTVHIMTDYANFKGERYYETAFNIPKWIKENYHR